MSVTHVVVRSSDAQRVRTDTASVIEHADGRLLITYHGMSPGPEGAGDFGAARVYLADSTDAGHTWGGERLVADINPGDLNILSPYLCQVGDDILLGYTRNHSKGNTSMELLRSTDGGLTFGKPSFVWEQAQEYRLQGGASCMLVLSSGRVLVPFQSTPEVWVADENEYVGSYYSDDNGHTWSISRNFIKLPLRGAMEPSVAELADGSLLMTMRTQLGGVFYSRSADAGESWSPAQTTGLRSPESCTCLRRLPGSDAVVLFWNDALYIPEHHHYGVRTPLSAAVSSDGGATWRKVGDLIAGDQMFTNLGCTFLRDGTAVLTYLLTGDPEVKNGVYRGYPRKKDESWAHGASALQATLISRDWFDTP